ncbi:DUF2249 domain-containing protein [Nakamurella lactea]|uniref:DUF2249 domain-containing protein n=1 Tax=Nakamurella lactea TaxID=459515 RepID=UPI0003FF9184|nr:DUF2249 domain-containing protein [Nakamurella lactea]
MTETRSSRELDVRALRKPDKHPAIFGMFDTLAVGESFVLVNNHDPRHLHDEFERDRSGGYGWEYLDRGPTLWRIQISRLTAAAPPRVLCNTDQVAGAADAAGAVFKLEMAERDLDANIVSLPAGDGIDTHRGPDLDVLLHVLAGAGTLTTETGEIPLTPGDLVWLPGRSQRQFSAGDDGLRYLTVHQRRRPLSLDPTVPPAR